MATRVFVAQVLGSLRNREVAGGQQIGAVENFRLNGGKRIGCVVVLKLAETEGVTSISSGRGEVLRYPLVLVHGKGLKTIIRGRIVTGAHG